MAYQGINHRATAGYATDGAGETYSLGEAYPTVRGGQPPFGYSANVAGDSRDRASGAGYDRRVQGMIGPASGTTFRKDLESTGVGTIRLAIGDISNPGSHYLQLLDGGTVFATITGTTTQTLQMLDATGTAMKADAIVAGSWATSNVAITHTFTSTNFTINLGDGASQTARLAHVSVDMAVADTVAPVLSSPTGAATGNTTASASVSSNEAGGTIWCLTDTAATATAAATKAGTSQTVTATGVQTFAARTGLTPDTLYYNHFVQDDAAAPPNTSAVVTSASFRTTGAVTFSGPVPTRNGVVGSAASFANASFFASAFTLTYTLQAGTLPAGLTLSSSTGAISGTPTTAGTSSGIVVRATDTNANTADTNAYSIVIAASNAAPTFPGSISNITGTGGSAITPVNVSGQFSDTDALAYTASPAGTAWPSGLVVNSSTGIISGTVATSTTTGLKVRATDTASQTVDSNAFNVTIAAVQPTFTPVPAGKNINGGARASIACRVAVYSLTTDALIGIKTGLTSTSTGLPPAFQLSSGAVAGTQYLCKAVADSNNADLGVFLCTPA